MPPCAAWTRPVSAPSVSVSGGVPAFSITLRAAVVSSIRAMQRLSFRIGSVSASCSRAAWETACSFSFSMIWSKPSVIISCVMVSLFFCCLIDMNRIEECTTGKKHTKKCPASVRSASWHQQTRDHVIALIVQPCSPLTNRLQTHLRESACSCRISAGMIIDRQSPLVNAPH